MKSESGTKKQTASTKPLGSRRRPRRRKSACRSYLLVHGTASGSTGITELNMMHQSAAPGTREDYLSTGIYVPLSGIFIFTGEKFSIGSLFVSSTVAICEYRSST
jgi:hypothetical protein